MEHDSSFIFQIKINIHMLDLLAVGIFHFKDNYTLFRFVIIGYGNTPNVIPITAIMLVKINLHFVPFSAVGVSKSHRLFKQIY